MPVTVDLRSRLDTDDFDFLADLHDAALDAAGNDGATTFDREDVFNRHKERLVDFALRQIEVGVHRVDELLDFHCPFVVTSFASSALSAEPRIIGVFAPS